MHVFHRIWSPLFDFKHSKRNYWTTLIDICISFLSSARTLHNLIMSKDNKKTDKPNYASTNKNLSKPKGRSFCCSMFIYTFVFVSGVVVATILPDLAGHHFKQPYGKEYGVMAERVFQDLPKYLKTFKETALFVSREVADRVWDLKSELERRFADMSSKKDDKPKTKSSTQRSTTRNHDHVHSSNADRHAKNNDF
ncbi:unnamed protein product [Adineta ricciae]|uniref:Uncharacterized protein n=2 Tax=Adineta ricciae TaxID=249248 RepID=A0A813QQW4_ADIRI|nr:unnamed protein product [Adineta ricciae]